MITFTPLVQFYDRKHKILKKAMDKEKCQKKSDSIAHQTPCHSLADENVKSVQGRYEKNEGYGGDYEASRGIGSRGISLHKLPLYDHALQQRDHGFAGLEWGVLDSS